MKKKIALLLAVVLVVATFGMVLAACDKGPSADALQALLTEVNKYHRSDPTLTNSNFNLIGRISTITDEGEVEVNVSWKSSSDKITISSEMNGAGFYTVTIPDRTTLTEDLNYTLTATLVNAKGKEYKDADGKTYSVSFSRTVNKYDASEPDAVITFNGTNVLEHGANFTDSYGNLGYEYVTWQENDITVKSVRGESFNGSVENANPARFYTKSTIEISYTAAIKAIRLTIDTSSSLKYAKGFDGLTADNATFKRVDDTVLIVLTNPATTFVTPKLASQTRIYKIEIFTNYVPTLQEEIRYNTTEEILAALKQLAPGETLPGGTYTLTGTVTEIGEHNDQYNETTVTIAVADGSGTLAIECYMLKDIEGVTLAVGDEITVTGILKNYDNKSETGKLEFDLGCTYVKGGGGGDDNPTAPAKPEGTPVLQVLSTNVEKTVADGSGYAAYAGDHTIGTYTVNFTDMMVNTLNSPAEGCVQFKKQAGLLKVTGKFDSLFIVYYSVKAYTDNFIKVTVAGTEITTIVGASETGNYSDGYNTLSKNTILVTLNMTEAKEVQIKANSNAFYATDFSFYGTSTGDVGGGDVDPTPTEPTAQESTIEALQTAPEAGKLIYIVEGIWSPTGNSGDQYGNGYLYDHTTGKYIVIYGMADTKEALTWETEKYAFSNPKQFQTLKEKFNAGDKIKLGVVYGIGATYEPYNKQFVSYFIEKIDSAENFKYTATVNVSGGNGSATLSKEADLVYGDVVTVNIQAAEGYVLSTLSINGQEAFRQADGSYKFNVNAGPQKVEVSFKTAPTLGEGVLYKLDTSLSENNFSAKNAYADTHTMLINEVTWQGQGNFAMNPWRIGGKNLTKVDRTLATISPIFGKVSKVTLSFGTINATLNSAKLEVYNTDPTVESATPVATKTLTVTASATVDVTPDSGTWDNCFYVLTLNVTCGSSNKYVQLNSITFEGTVD